MKAMIFAAGTGSRLGEITRKIPKALVDIDGKSALRMAVEKCTAHGFDDIVVNVHHFADMVEEEVGRLIRSGFRITVSDERDMLLDTGGGLYRARDFFDRKPFIVYNVDIITDLDLITMYRYHLEKNGLATLAVRQRPAERFLLADRNGLMRGWINRTTGERIVPSETSVPLDQIPFSGIHIVEPEIFNLMSEGVYSITSLYLKLIRDHNIYTYRNDDGFWVDIGTPVNLEKVRMMLKGGAG
jgi:NDP-sugar pyrophosphorylase family protein